MSQPKPFIFAVAKEIAARAAAAKGEDNNPSLVCPVCNLRVTSVIFNAICNHFTCEECASADSCKQCLKK